jgi:FtsP/CotA-like multicopper oxidase with cupredoxin domain
LSADLDGTQEENSLSVPPHGYLRYRITPGTGGSRWVHSHVMPMDDLTVGVYSGQFGFVYVDPKENPGRYDQEIFEVVSKLRSGDRRGAKQMLSLKRSGFGIYVSWLRSIRRDEGLP